MGAAADSGVRERRRSPEYILKTLLAGGVAGSAAKTLIAPLDRVKILFQTNNAHFTQYAGSMRGLMGATRDIWRSNGMRGLFQGHVATLLRIFPYAAIKFLAYEQYRALLMPTRADENAWRQFWAGSFAGMTSVIFTYPMELVRVRMAYEVGATGAAGIRRTCREIVRESGATLATQQSNGSAALVRVHQWPLVVANFYRGLSMSLAGMVPYAGMSFCTHSVLTEVCRTHIPSYTLVSTEDVNNGSRRAARDGQRPLRIWAELVCGGLSGAIAQTVSYPLEIIRRRVQVAGVDHPARYARAVDVARDIWRTRGFRGFFLGLSIGYIKVTPMVAVSFTVYDQMKWLLRI
ncbi:putative mitochondrial carrier protein [Thamnocephalis sphaerospora]|uniref:Putative mitochondrial carrier protein n=1 Tax=Thamnocephalis sphaerospora TaxID=78915 RepID=A0A4P9XWH3_9FUNG|nr:putative mitochondrial carrier protein [Thamnocephalis sphaerospora]|eukprot:RKP09951.1 putative mitochondrial carrier protein [Thamnocephalis sphaerospora]